MIWTSWVSPGDWGCAWGGCVGVALASIIDWEISAISIWVRVQEGVCVRVKLGLAEIC